MVMGVPQSSGNGAAAVPDVLRQRMLGTNPEVPGLAAAAPPARPSSAVADNRTSEDLLFAAKRGDLTGIPFVVAVIQRVALAKAKQMGLQRADADNIAQDVSLAVVQRLDRIESVAHLTRYARRATVNATYDFLASTTRTPGTTKEEELFDQQCGREPEPADNLIAIDSSERVTRAMGRLSNLYQEILEEAASGAPAKEIIDTLKITPGAYYTRLCKARAALAVELEKEGVAVPAAKKVSENVGRKKKEKVADESPDGGGEILPA